MRLALIAAAATLSLAAAAQAAPAAVSVQIGPALQAKAERTYGVKDVQQLAADLQRQVEMRLARTGAYDNAHVELVLVDAVPNHPTFKQMTDVPGLSMRSFGIGGARIEGRIVAADGTVTPISYRYYEPDIRQARGRGTWSDAEWTFDQFAERLAHGHNVSRG